MEKWLKEHGYKKVEKKEFDSYLNDYPNKLKADESLIGFPPALITYYDFTDNSKFTNKEVALHYLNEDCKDIPSYEETTDDYYIRVKSFTGTSKIKLGKVKVAMMNDQPYNFMDAHMGNRKK